MTLSDQQGCLSPLGGPDDPDRRAAQVHQRIDGSGDRLKGHFADARRVPRAAEVTDGESDRAGIGEYPGSGSINPSAGPREHHHAWTSPSLTRSHKHAGGNSWQGPFDMPGIRRHAVKSRT